VLVVPVLLHGFWPGIFAQGVAYATIFLSFSLVTGDGGMIWLSQATFAGTGWIVASRLAGEHHLPVLLALLLGGLVVAPVGAVIGYLTVRMGNIYVTLSTLTFGLLADEVLFPQPSLHPGLIAAPRFAAGDHALIYFCLAVFALIALVIVNVRHSTTGLGFAAVRTSPAAARTIGVSAVQMKVLLAGLAAFVAGIGGAMLAITLTPAAASFGSFMTLGGEIWLAALVTQGIRSNVAALFGGLTLALLPGICIVYLPLGSANFLYVFFGLGAVALARFSDGVLTVLVRSIAGALASARIEAPGFYRVVRAVGAAAFVLLVALVFGVRQLWWLWIVVYAAAALLFVCYLSAQTRLRWHGKRPGAVARAEHSVPSTGG
jgi:branched-chain amino acid transport system permease protein